MKILDSLSLLIVEDEEADFLMISRLLRSVCPNCETRWAINAAEALNLAAKVDHDLVFVDLNLGLDDGIDVVREIVEREPEASIIAVTGDLGANSETALTAGATDFILKSDITAFLLERTIRSTLRQNKMLAHLVKKQIHLQKLQQSSVLGEVSLTIAHEINNPLAVILGRLTLIKTKMTEDHDGILADVKDAIASCNRIQKIVKDIYNKGHEGTESYEPALENLTVIASQAIDLCRHRLTEAEVKISMDWPAEGLFIKCVEHQMAQVIVNILNNAIEAIRHLEERWVKVSIQPIGNNVVIEITDSGKIPLHLIDKVLGPYFSTRQTTGGQGIGLGLAKAYVQNHGGDLRVFMKEGHTCFEVKLPTFAQKESSETTATVLIIDDDKDVCSYLEDQIRGFGYRTMVATDGLDGLGILESQSDVGLVVCDVQMPIMDGITMYRKGRDILESKMPPFLFLTGHRTDIFPREIRLSGNAVLSKPIDTELLKTKLTELESRSRSKPS